MPSLCNQLAHPLSRFPPGEILISTIHSQKDKVLIIMGATGRGKSKLAIDLAIQFGAEIVNCDKIQIYRGLKIVTNKVTEEECRGVPHHLLGIIDDPDADYSAFDFVRDALDAIDSIVGRGRLPIVAGGSNSFIQSLVEDIYFRSRYDYSFIWVDVSPPVLKRFVSVRVDQMVAAGLVGEVRELFCPNADYSRGLRRAIGVPELDKYMRSKGKLEDAIHDIKLDTWELVKRQRSKIQRLEDHHGWALHWIDATEAFLKQGKDADKAWKRHVVGPAATIVGQFLEEEGGGYNSNTEEVEAEGQKRHFKDSSSSSFIFTSCSCSSHGEQLKCAEAMGFPLYANGA